VLRDSRNRILIMYLIVPLLAMPAVSPLLSGLVCRGVPSSRPEPITLASVGLMCTSTSENSPVYQLHLAVLQAIQEYNSLYGDGSTSYNQPISTSTAVGADATTETFKFLLQTTDRVHVAAHGGWSADGPIVHLRDGELNRDTIGKWDQNEMSESPCYLVFLSCCYSLGRSLGDNDIRLARAIKTKTNVRMVVGYQGEVEAAAAAFLAANFWWAHMAACRNPYGGYGGYSGAASFDHARYLIDEAIRDAGFTISLSLSFFVGYVVGFAFGPLEGILSGILSTILDAYIADVVGEWLLSAWENARNAFQKVDDGEYVPSLTPVSGNPYKGFVVTTE